MNGADVCREVRGWSTVPIVVLSARHSDDEKVRLLDAGADDSIGSSPTSSRSRSSMTQLLEFVSTRSGRRGLVCVPVSSAQN